MVEAPVEGAAVAAVQPFEHRVAPLFQFAAEKVVAKHGCDEECEHQGAEQGECDGPSHGAEEATFDTLQGKDRKVRNNDDDSGEEDGPLYFVGGHRNDFTEGLLVISEGSVAKDVLDHDDRAVNDHPKVECAQREQVCGDMAEIEKDGGEEQRKGDRYGDDQSAAYVAEEEKQNQGDEKYAVSQIAQNGVRGVMHQLAAVEVGDEFDSNRQ